MFEYTTYSTNVTRLISCRVVSPAHSFSTAASRIKTVPCWRAACFSRTAGVTPAINQCRRLYGDRSGTTSNHCYVRPQRQDWRYHYHYRHQLRERRHHDPLQWHLQQHGECCQCHILDSGGYCRCHHRNDLRHHCRRHGYQWQQFYRTSKRRKPPALSDWGLYQWNQRFTSNKRWGISIFSCRIRMISGLPSSSQ